jgi:hypothetical protein
LISQNVKSRIFGPLLPFNSEAFAALRLTRTTVTALRSILSAKTSVTGSLLSFLVFASTAPLGEFAMSRRSLGYQQPLGAEYKPQTSTKGTFRWLKTAIGDPFALLGT